jgi:hypothetical protein
LPACWSSTTSPILGDCGTGIREPLRRISYTKHARWVAKRPPQRKCILQASLSLGCDGISMNNCALLDYNPPRPWLRHVGNVQPVVGPNHPWPGLVGSAAAAIGPRRENLRGFWVAYPCTAGCPGGRRCIRGAGQVQCDAASLATCSGCAFAKLAPALHLQ